MKRLHYLLIPALAVGMLSCSPQKRLAYLLAAYPELRQDTVVALSKSVPLPADSACIDFAIADLRRAATQPIQAETKSGAAATIAPSAPDTYRLQVRTKADTIVLRDTVQVAAYTTRVAYKDRIVYRMSKGQRCFFWIGIIATAWATGAAAMHILLQRKGIR